MKESKLAAWQRPHEKGEYGWCVWCGEGMVLSSKGVAILDGEFDFTSPCPARTVRLSDNPAAVRMLKAMGSELVDFKIAMKAVGFDKGLYLEILSIERLILAAVRAYWEIGRTEEGR